MNRHFLKGSTVTLILTLLEEKEMYGYEMVKEVEKRSQGLFLLKEGTLYPILHTLEAKQWVESYWTEQGGRRRKYYRITQDGKEQLSKQKRDWLSFRNAMDLVIGVESQ